MGKIITFYSYKGGTGRTMALANVGYLLSLWGYKVLMVDWDLEAPGLENFFKELMDISKVSKSPGVIDILNYFQESDNPSNVDIHYWKKFLVPVDIGTKGADLHLLVAGNCNEDYFRKVRDLDISSLYSNYGGGEILEALRNDWKDEYDFILIDSRTGITDIGGVCTIQLPDTLVLFFTATEQALNGVVEVAQRAYSAQKELLSDRLRLVSIPIPSRFDSKEEFKLSQKWLDRFAKKLNPVFSNWLPTSVKPIQMLEVTRIPYSTYFSFGEKLPVVEQSRRDSGGLTYAYENICALLANDLEDVELLIEDRDRFVKRASTLRKRESIPKRQLFISYSHKDEEFLNKLMTHLKVFENTGLISVWSDDQITAGHYWYNQISEEISKADIVILLISADFLASDFIMREEVPRILEREKDRNLNIIPIIVRPSAWQYVDFIGNLQVLPKDGKPLSTLTGSELDSSLADIARQIGGILSN